MINENAQVNKYGAECMAPATDQPTLSLIPQPRTLPPVLIAVVPIKRIQLAPATGLPTPGMKTEMHLMLVP